jgi:hypothetical protein
MYQQLYLQLLVSVPSCLRRLAASQSQNFVLHWGECLVDKLQALVGAACLCILEKRVTPTHFVFPFRRGPKQYRALEPVL